MRFEFVAVGGRAKGKRSAGLEGKGEELRAESPSGIVKGISPRLNKKSKTFNWAGGVNLRLKAKAESDGGCVHRDMGYEMGDM